MNTPSQNVILPAVISLLAIILAFTLQIQTSFFSSDSYMGLRVNLADTILPLCGLIIAFSLFLKKSKWPNFYLNYTYVWLAALSGIFIFSLVYGMLQTGQLSHWGLMNKTFGFIILCAYFLMGAWFITNAPKEKWFLYLRLSLFFLLLVSVIQCTFFVLKAYEIQPSFYQPPIPLSGLMGNKNSYIFWVLSLLALASFLPKKVCSSNMVLFFWFLMPSIFLFSGARAGILAFPILIIALWIARKSLPLKQYCLSFLVGSLTVALVHITAIQPIVFINADQLSSIRYLDDAIEGEALHKIEEKVQHKGDSIRIKVLSTTLNMIKEKPILGNGLGTAALHQEKDWGEFINVIDCTPLWLWAETGILGLLTFLCFYALVAYKLGRQARHSANPDDQKLYLSVLTILLIFGVMSLFHELLYTRFLWFFMGIALAYPAQDTSGVTSKEIP